jgi:peroxiredoxin
MLSTVSCRIILTATILALLLTSTADAIPKKGEAAPPFSILTSSGQKFSLADLRGHVLVLEFFATWCNPCQTSMSHLKNIASRFQKQKLQIIALNIDEEPDSVLAEYSKANRFNFPITIATEKIRTDFGIRTIPTQYVINKKGIITERFTGFNDESAKRLDSLINQLLKEPF